MDIVIQILVKPDNISKRSSLDIKLEVAVLEIKQSFTICLLLINLQPSFAQVMYYLLYTTIH